MCHRQSKTVHTLTHLYDSVNIKIFDLNIFISILIAIGIQQIGLSYT